VGAEGEVVTKDEVGAEGEVSAKDELDH